MAVVWPTPTNRPTGYTVTAADWNTHADNLNNLNTRLGEATGPDNVMTRLSKLELLTGQSGTTGVGNYTLGERLGTGVTTTTSPTTGTATAQLTSIRNNIGDRLSHGQIYTEIGALKTAVTGLTTTTNTLTTNQGTRGSNGTIYSEINALKAGSGALVGNVDRQSVDALNFGTSETTVMYPTANMADEGVTYSEGTFTVASSHYGRWLICANTELGAMSGNGITFSMKTYIGGTDYKANAISYGSTTGFGAAASSSVIARFDATNNSFRVRVNANTSGQALRAGQRTNITARYLGPV